MNDLRYALRTLARSPGFALAAVVTLAVGIGANAAVFSVVEKVLLRPLPFEGANRLFVIRETSARQDRMGVSGPDFDDFYAQARSFDAFAATVPHFTLTWTGDGEARTVNCAGVTKDIFPALGLRPLMGRVYTPEEYHVDGVQVVISRRFWKTQLGSDPNVLGRVLHLDGTAQTVIGVMPDVPDLFPDVDVWGKIVPELEFMHWRQNHFLTVIGRLKATASPAQAAQELTAILHRAGPESRELTATVAPLKAELVGDVRTQLMIVMGAVVLVLITGSMNVTCLLLARMSARTSELAIRVTLGAGRARMLRQFVTENLLLLCLGSALGLILAGALVQLGARLDLGAVPRAQPIGINGPGLAFTVVIALVLSVALAWAPTSILDRLDLNSALKSGKSLAGRRRSYRALVVSEVCCAAVLLVAAGLLVRSFWLVQRVEPGFQIDHLLTAYVRTNAYTGTGAYFNNLLDRVSETPGVQGAAVSSCVPAARSATATVTFRDRVNDPANPVTVEACFTSPEFFTTLRTPLERGRFFTTHDDRHAPAVLIVNQAFARKYWPGEDPLGKQVAVSVLGTGRRMLGTIGFRNVVGVVGNMKQEPLDVPSSPVVYLSFHQDETNHVYAGLNLFVRTTADPRLASGTVRDRIHSLNPDQPLEDMRTMDEVLGATLARRRLSLVLMGSFAGLALVLCAIGVYGTIAYSLSQRTREFGIRSAVGAARGDLVKMVMREGLWLSGMGVTIGLGFSLVVARAMERLLFGIAATDPWTFVAAAATLMSVAAAACFTPAWKGSSVDPALAMRAE